MLCAAAALYSAWLIGPLLNPALDPSTSVASELAARDQPWGWLFRATDVLCGALVLAVAAVERMPRLIWAGAVLFAVSTVADAGLAPLPCAPSIDPACPGVPVGHLLTSLGALAGVVLSLAGLIATRGWVRWAAAGLLGYTVVLSVGGGWVQRADLVGVAAWLCLLGIQVQRHSRGSEPT